MKELKSSQSVVDATGQQWDLDGGAREDLSHGARFTNNVWFLCRLSDLTRTHGRHTEETACAILVRFSQVVGARRVAGPQGVAAQARPQGTRAWLSYA